MKYRNECDPMKLSKKMENALNEQINAEWYSSYLYLSMAVYFESMNLKGFANWMHVQAHEEWDHGMKFLHYMQERGNPVSMKAIAKPQIAWKSALAVFQDSLKHEQKVTGLINRLSKMAKTEKDAATEIFLQWFISEQVEEEASVTEIIEKLKMAGDKGPGLMIVDRDLAQRKA